MEQQTDIHNDGIDGAVNRAVMLRTASVRREPRKRGGRIVKLNMGAAVAVRRRAQFWCQIDYVDPVTGRSSDGWIYETLVRHI